MSTITAGNVTVSCSLSADTTGNLVFQSGGNVTAMTIDTSQNVGIGTSSPAAPLDVKGVVRFTNSANAANYGEIYDGGGLIIKSQNSNPMYFFTSNTERARIDSSGTLIVNSTSKQNGDVKFSVTANSGAAMETKFTADYYPLLIYRSGNLYGSIYQSGTSTAFNTSSDYRLKENIQPMTGALAKVAALKPCTYTWKFDGSDGQGFIAHELAEVMPDCVTGEKDAMESDGVTPRYQGVDTSFLVATLTAAIQEQQQMIETLQAEVAALKGVKA